MFPALYAILDATPSLPPESTLSFAEKLAAAGVELIQLRAKNLSSRRFHELSAALVRRLAPYPVRVIVNDRPDIAALAGAHGVHVGQEDLPVADARKICPPRNGWGFRHTTSSNCALRTSLRRIILLWGPSFRPSPKRILTRLWAWNFCAQREK